MATTGTVWREGRHMGWIVRQCVRRVCHWPVPPNWTGAEWMREVAAHGDAAALEASCQYDATRGGEPAVFLMSRVMARLLTRYRQEWNFARRVTQWSWESDDEAALAAVHVECPGDMRQTVMDAVNGLAETDRWIVVQMMWHDRDQGEIARELGISQPAVSKRYRNAVRQLRSVLPVRAGRPRASDVLPVPGRPTSEMTP